MRAANTSVSAEESRELLTKTKARAHGHSSKGDTGNRLRGVESLLGCFLMSGSGHWGRGEKLQADSDLVSPVCCLRSGVQVNNSLNFGTFVLTDVTIS